MRAKLTYPTKASFHIEEHWPVPSGDIEVRFDVKDARLTSIICTWSLGTRDQAPQLRALAPGQRGFAGVDFHLARQNEIEHLVRTIQGILALYGTIDVDFERATLEWIADTAEEELGIQLILSSKPPEVDVFKPETLDFGIIGHAVVGAGSASGLEVALSFLRRGRRDLKERRYIDAIYNCFFFLETQYAAGYSKPKEVAKRLKANALVAQAFAGIRYDPVDPPRGFTTPDQLKLWEERIKHLSRPDEEIIDELVKLRGTLHHHAGRGPNSWHPDKPRQHRVAAHTLHDLAFACAHLTLGPLLEDPAIQQQLQVAAEAAKATTIFRFEAQGVFPPGGASVVRLEMSCAGTVINRAMVLGADRAFRATLASERPGSQLKGYTITHTASDRVYGRYERHDFDAVLTQMRKSPTSSG